MEKISRTDAKKRVEDFFEGILNEPPKEIRKIKRLAMKHNISLKENRKLFCKKCYSVYLKPGIKIKNKMKKVTCEKCGYVSNWKLK